MPKWCDMYKVWCQDIKEVVGEPECDQLCDECEDCKDDCNVNPTECTRCLGCLYDETEQK